MATNRRLIVNIQRRGGANNDATLEAHARRVLTAMLSTRLLNTIRVTVKLRAGLSKDRIGECQWRNLGKSTAARSKHYAIVIQRDMNLRQQLRTLTHELKHLEQMARGRLDARTVGGVWGWYWRPGPGRAVRYETSVPWADRPWEIEARAAEREFHGKALHG